MRSPLSSSLEATVYDAEETERIAVGGIDICVRYKGRGPDVVVLHGGPGADLRSLLPQFDSLARSRRLIYYDQRGCGGSRAPGGAPLDWRQHVADLVGLLDCWEISAAHVAGYSWGGLLALLFAIAHKDRVASLALISPAPATFRERTDFLQRLSARMDHPWIVTQRRQLEGSGLRYADPAAFRQRAFELTVAPYFKNPADSVGLSQSLVSARVREAVWRSLGRYDIAQDLVTLSLPALVLHGRHDPIPLAAAERIATLLGARFEVLENSGHMPFIEEFDRFVAVLDEFLPREEP
ncbi:MAG: alpha/beta hydrolase [Gemmatimonadota bacterium]|nr:MAG: alpha/beta hydrolase [Gemmatimonadota bacterium]